MGVQTGAGWNTIHRLIVWLGLERTPRDHPVPSYYGQGHLVFAPLPPHFLTIHSRLTMLHFSKKSVNFSVVGALVFTCAVCCCTAYLYSRVTSVSYFEDKKGEIILQKLCICSSRADYCNGNDKGRQSLFENIHGWFGLLSLAL